MPVPPDTPRRAPLTNRAFLLLVVAVSAAFAWIVMPFFGAVLWATILAIVFRRVHRNVLHTLQNRRTWSALVTLLIAVFVVILPTTLVGMMLIQETASVYQAVQSGEIDIAALGRRAIAIMPEWLGNLLQARDPSNPSAIQERLSDGLMRAGQALSMQALNFGQNAIDFALNAFISLYLLFFFLRDGDTLVAHIQRAVPLQPELQRHLMSEFTGMIRAIVKGTVVVAIVQGVLGGLILWILGFDASVFWGVVMAFASLLPAFGTALVWGPIAIYLLVTGAVLKAIALIAYGILVIGLVDNFLRPMLVGKDTRIPDYVVLVTTLGGIAVLGFNGIVVGPVVAALFVAVWAVVSASRYDGKT